MLNICKPAVSMTRTPVPVGVAGAPPSIDRGGLTAGIAFLLLVQVTEAESFTLKTLLVLASGAVEILWA